jgi:hypothetical protein
MDQIKIEAIHYSGESFEAVAPLGDEMMEINFCVDCETCCPGACTGCTQCNKCNLLF